MRFIRPIEVTPDKLISSNVAETDFATWVSTATYKLGDKVIWNHRIYQALAAVPAGVTPGAEVVTEETPAKWQDVGATNRWKMFDEVVGTLTTNPGSVSVTIKPGEVVNSLALFNVQGESVTVTMTDPVEGVVYSRTFSMIDAAVDNWYDWFFADIETMTSVVVLDVPAYGTANISVTVNSSGTAGIGALVIGKATLIGASVYGARVGIDDYSRKERDVFGNIVITPRAYSDTGDFSIVVDTDRVAKIKKLLTEIRAKPVVWIGEETYEATIIYGFFKSFDLVYSGPEVSDCQLSIEGLI
ncbi:hypothetical protein [Pseudomonas abietaniphila]|uniref:hypothetical protein n=1 Tax=Pseudomonas abietaniphila TaxID=89065 RepID=UPI000785FA62|nr:hypothetical protein [Pseudomonas abietaniphila]